MQWKYSSKESEDGWLVWDKADVKMRITRHFQMINRPSHQEDITILNVYATDNELENTWSKVNSNEWRSR